MSASRQNAEAAPYLAVTRIRTDGGLFLPGDGVWGLSDADAAQFLAAGQIVESASQTPPKSKSSKKAA